MADMRVAAAIVECLNWARYRRSVPVPIPPNISHNYQGGVPRHFRSSEGHGMNTSRNSFQNRLLKPHSMPGLLSVAGLIATTG